MVYTGLVSGGRKSRPLGKAVVLVIVAVAFLFFVIWQSAGFPIHKGGAF